MAVRILSILSGLVFTSLLIVSVSISASAQTPRLIVDDGKVWVKYLDPEVLYTFTRYFNSQEDWKSIFPVSTKNNTNGITLPGTYETFKDAVSFTPRFPFAMHMVYVAKFDAVQLAHNTNEIYLPAMEAQMLELEFSSSRVTSPPAQLVEIYPTSSTLPENLLRFHLTFSKSMTVGQVYSKVKLVDENGKEIAKPFLIVDQELWDNQMKTVTILFDPGRIKRGLRPNMEMKPVLSEGEIYTLQVESGWKDIDGLATTETFTKRFRCTKPDRSKPEAGLYEILPPQAESSPVTLNLKEPHDYILLASGIKVLDENGNLIPGRIVVESNESSIRFVPKNPWMGLQYTLQINPLLEDLAGNNLNRLFDEDLASPSTKDRPIHELSFKFAPSAH